MLRWLKGFGSCYLAVAFLFGTMAYQKTGSLKNGFINGMAFPARLLAVTYVPALAPTVNTLAAM